MIPPDQEFTLRLDQGVESVTVNGAPAKGSGLNWKIVLELQDGQDIDLRHVVKWWRAQGIACCQVRLAEPQRSDSCKSET